MVGLKVQKKKHGRKEYGILQTAIFTAPEIQFVLHGASGAKTSEDNIGLETERS